SFLPSGLTVPSHTRIFPATHAVANLHSRHINVYGLFFPHLLIRNNSRYPMFLSSQFPLTIGQMNGPAAHAASSELSCPPTIVPVNEDILWCNQPQPNDPCALTMINPWESQYSIRPIDYLIVQYHKGKYSVTITLGAWRTCNPLKE
ncbi:hypothetical protein AZE42_13748, partial [Rhizopogon vesiculosus]